MPGALIHYSCSYRLAFFSIEAERSLSLLAVSAGTMIEQQISVEQVSGGVVVPN